MHTNKSQTFPLSLSLSLVLLCSITPSHHSTSKMFFVFFCLRVFVLSCLKCLFVVMFGVVWMRFFIFIFFFNFGHIGGVPSARGAGSIQEKYSILKCSDGRGIKEGKALRRRCCTASNDRCVSACVCVCVLRVCVFRVGGGGHAH